MACSCDRNGGSSSYYDQLPPAPAPAAAVVPDELMPEWLRELLFAVLVALVVALIMREGSR